MARGNSDTSITIDVEQILHDALRDDVYERWRIRIIGDEIVSAVAFSNELDVWFAWRDGICIGAWEDLEDAMKMAGI